ncbi:MAG: hypothetical protein HYX59_09380 [Elusimicrobia bacterium]|nr:hypothetical protein [Elusimicrobiota bacterium]
MRTIMTALAVLFLAGAVRAGAPEKAKVLELRAGVRDGQQRLKRLAVEQRKTLALIREREKSDWVMVKASAAKGETLHDAKVQVRERSRRDRLALREGSRSERRRLKAAIKAARAEMAALRRKK